MHACVRARACVRVRVWSLLPVDPLFFNFIAILIGFQGYKTCGLPSRAVEQTIKYVVPQKNCQQAEQNNTFVGKNTFVG